MNFSNALECLKNSERITRKAWEEGEFLFLYLPIGFQKRFILKHTAVCEANWVASHSDILANDWVVIPQSREVPLPPDLLDAHDKMQQEINAASL